MAQAFGKFPEDDSVQLVTKNLILNAVIDGGVVVYFDDHRVALNQLYIYTVQSFADEGGDLGSHPGHLLGNRVDGYGFNLAGAGGTARLVMVNLPVAACHEIFTGIYAVAIQHADPPVKFGWHELLGEQD